MSKPLIYLASPYTDPDHTVMEDRFHKVCEKAGELMRQGHMIFSPIAHTHPIAVRCELPRPFEFWEDYDRIILARCNALWIYQLPGWAQSKGVAREVVLAMEYNLSIEYIPS